jgi:hypothetical protein
MNGLQVPIASLAFLLTVAGSGGTPAAAGTGQVPLDTASVEQFLTCAPRLASLARGLRWADGHTAPGESQGLVARLAERQGDVRARTATVRVLQGCGLTGLEAFSTLAYSIDLARLAAARPAGPAAEPPEDPLLLALRGPLAGLGRLSPLPGNVEAVRPYLNRLDALDARLR